VQDSGIAGMVRSAAWLEHVGGLEVLSLGRAACSLDDCTLEICGSQLLFYVSVRGTWIWLSAAPLDSPTAPSAICNFADGPAGWTALRKLVLALERSGIRALHPRPIRLGDTGPNAYVIDY
jgi:hypothetical protein